MHRTIAVGMVALGLVTTAAYAEPREYRFDMAHSRVFFDVSHLGYSMMVGRFGNFDGQFHFDPDDPAASSLDVTIDAASVDMFHEGLNNHLKTPDFFDVETYPELRFTSERVERKGDDLFDVHGQLTMLGQTHPVTFEAVLNQTGTNRAGAPMVGFSAEGSLDRTQWGMNFGAPMVGTQIGFRLEIEAIEAGDT